MRRNDTGDAIPDYSRLTIDEMDDVARNVDRVAYPEVAKRVDEELGRRKAAGEIITLAFLGGGRIGVFGLQYSWPFAQLRFTRETLTLRTTFFGVYSREVSLARADVRGFRRITRWLGGGFEILHDRGDLDNLVFRPWPQRPAIEALREYGWPVPTDLQ